MFSGSNDDEVQTAINILNEYYANGDARWFDYLAEDAKVFSINSTDPFIGREAYRVHFEPILIAQHRQLEVLNIDIQMLGDDSAIVTQTLQITQDEIPVIVRQSVVWGKREDGWKINHLHTAMIGGVPGPTTGSFQAVRVLNERIATVASVLGVAQ